MAAGTYNTNRLVIRGVGSRTPYNTNRIKAYLDDIPLTSGDGVSTLEDQDQLAIGRMEILKGPGFLPLRLGIGRCGQVKFPLPLQQWILSQALCGGRILWNKPLYILIMPIKMKSLPLAGALQIQTRKDTGITVLTGAAMPS